MKVRCSPDHLCVMGSFSSSYRDPTVSWVLFPTFSFQERGGAENSRVEARML